MYQIIKDGSVISYEDKARFVKLQSNGTYCLCDEPEAQGIVVNNEYICHLEGKPELSGMETVTIKEFNGTALLAETQSNLALADEQILELAYENLLLKGGFDI